MGSRAGKSACPAHYSGTREPAGAGSLARFLDECPHPSLSQDQGGGTITAIGRLRWPSPRRFFRGNAEEMLFAADEEAVQGRDGGSDDRLGHVVLGQHFEFVAGDVRDKHGSVLARRVELVSGDERRGVIV